MKKFLAVAILTVMAGISGAVLAQTYYGVRQGWCTANGGHFRATGRVGTDIGECTILPSQGGGGESGGSVSGANSLQRGAAILGIGVGAAALIRDMARENEARQQYQLQQQATELQQRLEEERQASQREMEEQERRRQAAAAARAADDARRQMMENPFASGISGLSAGNPFAGSGSASPAGAANPFTATAPGATPPARISRAEPNPVPSRGFRSDSEIKALCASAPNPKACEKAEFAARERLGPYQRWRAEAAAARARGLLDAEDDIDRAIAEYRRQRAQEGPQTLGPGATNFPIEAFRQAPDIDRRGDGYDECRRGAVRPDQIVGCYEQPARPGGSAAPRASGGRPETKKRDALAQQVRERRAQREAATATGGGRAQAVAVARSADQEAETTPTRAVPRSDLDRAPPPQGFTRQILSREECARLGGRSIPVAGAMPVCEHRVANPFQMRESDTRQEVDDFLRRFRGEPAGSEAR